VSGDRVVWSVWYRSRRLIGGNGEPEPGGRSSRGLWLVAVAGCGCGWVAGGRVEGWKWEMTVLHRGN
jgi:hypothetical protein